MSSDPHTGTVLFQDVTSLDDDNEAEFVALLAAIEQIEFDHYALARTARVKQESLDAMVRYHRTHKKPSLDFMQRKTARLLKECNSAIKT